VRVVVLGGEAAHRGDVGGFRRQFSRDCLLVNGFGPSECTVALQFFVDADTPLARDAVPIGFPVLGTEVLLLDGSGEPTSPFGEIAIRSSSVATGYWGRPDLTAAAFVPDPAGHGRRLYRTGDLGRLLPDGSLEFVGRRDLQAKVRGFRVDPGEVESVLVTHPGVAQCAVVVRGESFGEGRLLACVVPRGDPAPRPGELRRFLAERIPDYLIPTDWISLDALPLTPNGKVDRRRLPEVDTVRSETGPGGTAPRTVVERELVSIWSEVLGVSAIGVEDEFLALGGHSISAMQILSRIRDAFGVELGFRAFFERPTIADQAVEVTGLLLDDGIPRR
jgi:acyl-CoA synthetase (AMP-forming)/AMP-acid ligase II/aryl carrier-like protein